MQKNKTTTYLLYALGEIILVVFGILIALYVSNWNQTKKDKTTERLYLSNLLSDLKDQQTSITSQLEQEQSFFEAAGTIIQDFKDDNCLQANQEFFANTTELGSRRTFVIIDPTYTDLISSGNIGLIKSAKLKTKLIEYYSELERVEKIIQNNNSLIVDQIYLRAYQKLGYAYYSDFPSMFDQQTPQHKGMMLASYNEKLESISKKVLAKEDFLLQFMNAINLRNTVAIGHYQFLSDTQKLTAVLIQELEGIVKDKTE